MAKTDTTVQSLFNGTWKAWGTLTSILLFFALWDLGHWFYGDFILPSPQASIAKLRDLFATGAAGPELGVTAYRALAGFSVAVIGGSSIGMIAGRSPTIAMVLRPWVTMLLGIPPIAWIVLALLWFGATDSTPIFTVAVTALPVAFAAGMQGSLTLDRDLDEMACTLGASKWLTFIDVQLPHVLSYLFPAWITALGTSWKVVVMAELLSSGTGIGAGLATARVNLDTTATMAWILTTVGALLLTEYGILDPLKRRVEHWRDRN